METLASLAKEPLDLTNPSVRLAAERTALAVERTRLAHERTLMAWVRTATSLISFGFTIYKTFQYLQDSKTVGTIPRAFTPRWFALTMITVGVFPDRSMAESIATSRASVTWSTADSTSSSMMTDASW